MTKAPERIWVEDERHVGGICHVYYETDLAHQYYATEYLHIDHALALVAVEREAIAAHIELLCRPISEAGFVEFSDRVLEIVPLIRARTNPDAQAALERTLHDTKTEWWNKGYKAGKQEARNEALREAAEIAKHEGEGFAGMREGVMFDRLSKKILALITEDQSDD